MYLLLYLLIIILSLIYIKNDNFNIIVIIFTLIIIYMHPYCTDYVNYENVYNLIAIGFKYTDTGIGWYYVCLIFIKLGINFRMFKTIISTISLLMINHSIKQILDKKHQRYFWGLYLIFPLLIQCIQFRFLLATAFVIFVLKYLPEKNKKSIIISIFSLLIASLIHSSYYFFFGLYLLLLIKPFQKHTKLSTILIFVILIVLVFNKKILIDFISHFINLVRINRYFIVSNKVGTMLTIALDIIAIYINSKFLKIVLKNKEISNLEDSSKNILFFANKLAILNILIIPFLFFDNNFIRMLEISIMFTNIALLLVAQNGIKYVTLFKVKIKILNLLLFNSIFYFMIFIPKLNVLWSILQ